MALFLNEKIAQYNTLQYIETDPIQIPHEFQSKEDIEISAFLTATIAWGKRAIIIRKAREMMELLEYSPYDFVCHHSDNDLKGLKKFVHRTFQGVDLIYFVQALKHIYENQNGLEGIFTKYQSNDSVQFAIHKLKEFFFELPHPKRTKKHISDPLKGSAAKRINMFLRWMVRNDKIVDFGIWKGISPAKLSCPLDVHSGNVSRKLNILKRKQNDAKALQELDTYLRELDKNDPSKYDYALFGLGVFEGF